MILSPSCWAELKRSLGAGLTGFELMWDNYLDKVLEVVPICKTPLPSRTLSTCC